MFLESQEDSYLELWRLTGAVAAGSRRRFGFCDGSLVIVEEREDGILLLPAVATPV